MRRGAPKSRVGRYIVRVGRSRSQEGNPVGISLVPPRLEPNIRVVNGRDRTPALVGVLDVPGGEAGVGDGVVELGVELGRLEGFLVELGADDGAGEAVPARDGGLAPEVGRVGIVGGAVGGIDSADGLDEQKVGFVLSRVGLGRGRGAEAGDVAQGGKWAGEAGLGGVWEGSATGGGLVDSGLLRAEGEVDKVDEIVVGASLCYLGGGSLADLGGLLALAGVGVETDDGDDGAESGVNGGVLAGAMVDPEDGVVSGVGDGELLELETLTLGVHGCFVDGTLDDGCVPTGGRGRKTTGGINYHGGLVNPRRDVRL